MLLHVHVDVHTCALYMYMLTYAHVYVHVFSVVYVSCSPTCTFQNARRCICVPTHTDYAHYVSVTERAIHTKHVHVEE